MDNSIFVTTSFEGYHCWPDAPEAVAFLRSRHRHIFHVRVDIEITHNDRELEFILFKKDVEYIIQNNINIQHADSCEMMCDKLYKHLSAQYPNRCMIIEISEDGENGARKRYDK